MLNCINSGVLGFQMMRPHLLCLNLLLKKKTWGLPPPHLFFRRCQPETSSPFLFLVSRASLRRPVNYVVSLQMLGDAGPWLLAQPVFEYQVQWRGALAMSWVPSLQVGGEASLVDVDSLLGTIRAKFYKLELKHGKLDCLIPGGGCKSKIKVRTGLTLFWSLIPSL